jgi:hypothetical protein
MLSLFKTSHSELPRTLAFPLYVPLFPFLETKYPSSVY